MVASRCAQRRQQGMGGEAALLKNELQPHVYKGFQHQNHLKVMQAKRYKLLFLNCLHANQAGKQALVLPEGQDKETLSWQPQACQHRPRAQPGQFVILVKHLMGQLVAARLELAQQLRGA